MVVSVPLRGCGFEIMVKIILNAASRLIVSVPLRGCGFEMIEIVKSYGEYEKFPSPCGDVVLKFIMPFLTSFISNVSVPLRGCGFEILRRCLVFDFRKGVFPSPCGDVVLKSNEYVWTVSVRLAFPSPYGDMVLKSEADVMKQVAESSFPSPYGDMVLK